MTDLTPSGWKQDDIGHFANHVAGPSAQVVREGRRWAWYVFQANGVKLWKARSATLAEAKDNAEIMMRRAVDMPYVGAAALCRYCAD